MRMLWKNIKGLVGAYDQPPTHLSGKEMRNFAFMEDAWLAIEDGKVVDFGAMSEFPGIVDWSGLEVLDCSGRYVMPAWCDSHTHLVFAAPRGGEFLARLEGKSYQEIAAAGGGILNSAKALQSMPEEQLLSDARERLKHVMKLGTGAIEIKSGYGLTSEAELKMLRVIAALKAEFDLPIRATFLGCHAVPEGDWTSESWTEHVIKELLPKVAEANLADYVDAFCEEGYFSADDVEAFLKASNDLSIPGKVHVNQFNSIGGVKMGIENSVRSLDHLEELSVDDLEALALRSNSGGSPLFACALPGCSYFLSIPYAPVRRLMDANVPVALATDFNPGSAPSGNMGRVVQMGMVKMKMHPLEAIAAATINGAAAMGLADVAGTIGIGRSANLLLTKPMDGLETMGYAFGEESVEKVFIGGVQQ
ncbi:MAG: imidazolonepropionase [Crocinitomicaceae bacterium]|jgi:imidazolonepropionase|nr:imidazolonepropionase [Crocinitomicaceae bacterium]